MKIQFKQKTKKILNKNAKEVTSDNESNLTATKHKKEPPSGKILGTEAPRRRPMDAAGAAGEMNKKKVKKRSASIQDSGAGDVAEARKGIPVKRPRTTAGIGSEVVEGNGVVAKKAKNGVLPAAAAGGGVIGVASGCQVLLPSTSFALF